MWSDDEVITVVVAIAHAMTTRAVARHRAADGATSNRRNAANLSSTGWKAGLIKIFEKEKRSI